MGGVRLLQRAFAGRLCVLVSSIASGLCGLPLAVESLPAQSLLTQTLVVAPFSGVGDARAGLRVSDGMRDAIRRHARRGLEIVGTDSVTRMLRGQGITRPETARELDLVLVARIARADEVLVGEVRGRGDTLEVRASIVLLRDPRQREPLPTVRAVGREATADALARAVVAARGQMDPLRRCENAAREGRRADAIAAATQALTVYPRGVLGRVCLARTLVAGGAPADSVRELADYILSRDSTSLVARTIRAQAFEGLNRVDEAVRDWTVTLAMRPDSADFATFAIERLLQLSRPRPALTALDSIAPRHPGDVRFPRQRFRALHALERWPATVGLGDSLDKVDPVFSGEPAFALRYVEAMLRHGDTLRAIAKSARSVADHPQDGRLYVQYVRLIAGENLAALSRGLSRFPRLAELRVLAAQQARAAGDRAAERAALAHALDADASLLTSHMRLAELWFQDGRPDSAYHALRRAPRSGSGATMLRSYAMGRGVELLRAAIDSVPQTYAGALAFLTLADSVDSKDDTRSLVVAALLQTSRAELVAAANAPDCDGLRRSRARLDESAATLERGIGSGAAAEELRGAQQALEAAVEESLRRSCPVVPPPR